MVADHVYRLARIARALDREAQQVEHHDAVLVLALVAECRLVADGDTMLVATELGPPAPEGFSEDDLVGAASLRDIQMGDSDERAVGIIARLEAHHVLGLVDLGIRALCQEHGTPRGGIAERYERVTHSHLHATGPYPGKYGRSPGQNQRGSTE